MEATTNTATASEDKQKVKMKSSTFRQSVVLSQSPQKNNSQQRPSRACPSLLWSDEFDGTTLGSDWEIQQGDGCDIGLCGWGNNELQSYSSSNIAVENGVLKIEARKDVNSNTYTSGRIRTLNRQDFSASESGRLEARIQLPVGQGVWPAFWMLPTDQVYGTWPASGEIDIMENIGHEVSRIHGTIHYGPNFYQRQSQGATFDLPNDERFTDDFHTFAIEWEESSGSEGGYIRWIVDDILYSTKTPNDIAPFNWPFDERFHFVLNVAVGGIFPGYPDESTVFPQTMKVDYVRVYDSPLPSLSGPSIVSDSNFEYKLLNGLAFGGSSLVWEVPNNAVIISGQNTDTILVHFGDQSGYVSVTITPTCDESVVDKTIKLYVSVLPPFVWDASLENFDVVSPLFLTYSSGTFVDNFENPDVGSSINTSPLVGKYTRNPSIQYDVLKYDATSIINDANLYVAGTKKFYLDVYTTDAAIGTQILIQLQSGASLPQNYPVGRHSRYSAYTNAQSTWERLAFDFIDTPDGSVQETEITEITILIAPNSYSGHTFHIDNLDSYVQDSNPTSANPTLIPSSNPSSLSTSPSSEGQTMFVYDFTLENFDDAVSPLSLVYSVGVLSDNSNNPDPTGVNTSPLVGKYTRNASERYDHWRYTVSILKDATEYVLENKKIYLDIYTTDAPIGTTLLIQLESSAALSNGYPTGRHSRFHAITTTQSNWERLQFSFLDTPDPTVQDSDINNLVILISPDTFTGHTLYFDNFDSYVKTVAGEPTAPPSIFESSPPSTTFSTQPSISVSSQPSSQDHYDWILIYYDDFESGWGNYKKGGNDAKRFSGAVKKKARGQGSLFVRDNSGHKSSFLSKNSIDISTFSQVQVKFDYIVHNFKEGEDFFAEYRNGSGDWKILSTFKFMDNFHKLKKWYRSIKILDTSGISDLKIRFRCDASSNRDKVFIDNVYIYGWGIKN